MLRNVLLQNAFRFSDARFSGIAFCRGRIAGDNRRLARFASILSRLDDFKFAAFRQHFFHSKRAALHFEPFSAFYVDGAGGAAELVG